MNDSTPLPSVPAPAPAFPSPPTKQNIEVSIVAHSINPSGIPLVSWVLRYPRMIHAELMTHRMASRNAASSRARPIKGMIDDVMQEMAQFEFWGQNEAGMQANGPLTADKQKICQDIWTHMGAISAQAAKSMSDAGAHKQHANRMLEPYGHITTVLTTSIFCLENFFSLRADKAAEPSFQVLSYRMLNQYLSSKPKLLQVGEWHMPFIDKMPDGLTIDQQLKVATARACWVSYNKHGKDEFDVQDAIDRHDSALELAHWSPFEHCAKAMDHDKDYNNDDYPWSNFDNPSDGLEGRSWWFQYRKCFANECRKMTRQDMEQRLEDRPQWITL